MIKYIVKLNYDSFEFSDRLAAIDFADAAKEHQADGQHVVIELVKEGAAPAFSSLKKLVVGERIRMLRRSARMSQKDAALAADMKQTQWSRYECGHETPRWRTLLKIAKALNVDISILT